MHNNYEYLIRADGSHQLGLGHIFRTKTLAKYLISKGKNTLYVSRENKNVCRLIENIDYFTIKADIKLEEELNIILNLVKKYQIKTIINDLLFYDEDYLNSLSDFGVKIVTFHENRISDPFSDMIINYNTFNKALDNNNSHNKNCLGPKYCIFPDTLTEKESINIKNNVKKVLLSFGGSDPCDYTTKIAKLIINNHHLLGQIEEIIVHLGPSNRQSKIIHSLIEKSVIKINIQDEVKDLHSIMIQSDLALSSGGNTMYELCYLGIPTIIFPQNAHQEVFAKELSDHQLVSLISRKNCNNENYILKLLIKLIKNKSLRKRMNQSSIKIFDPNGVRRVGEAIFCL